MANLNDYALTQFKLILGDTGSSSDSTYLPYLQQAVYDVDARLQIGMSVAIDGTDYTLSPDPGDETATLWNVIARGGIWRYLAKLYRDYLDEMEGYSSVRDEVTSFSRNAIVNAKKQEVQDAKDAFDRELFSYTFSASGTAIVAEELGLAEDAS